jgi:hypothetical protein
MNKQMDTLTQKNPDITMIKENLKNYIFSANSHFSFYDQTHTIP